MDNIQHRGYRIQINLHLSPRGSPAIKLVNITELDVIWHQLEQSIAEGLRHYGLGRRIQ
jgi:hypothetical protein